MPFLTDSGLDNFGTTGVNYSFYAAIGTGALTPSIATTTLANEVQRSNSSGGFSTSNTFPIVGNKIRRETTFTRVFDITSAINVTEWAMFASSSGGSCSFVDRFRSDPNDVNSSEVTLTLQSGDQLQMELSNAIELDWGLMPATVPIDDNGSITNYSAEITPYTRGTFNEIEAGLIFETFLPNLTGTMFIGSITLTGSTQKSVTEMPDDYHLESVVLQSYIAGSYQRDKLSSHSTSESNGDIYGFHIRRINGGFSGGIKSHFLSPAFFSKTALQTLDVTLRSSWSRL